MHVFRYSMFWAVTCYCMSATVQAGELPDYRQLKLPGLVQTAVGVTRRATPIVALVDAKEPQYDTRKCRVLLIGGFDGERRSVDAVLETVQWFTNHDDAAAHRELISIAAIACANPDGLLLNKGFENGVGGTPVKGYPPQGKLYLSETNPEAQYLWQWIQLHAPDVVYEVRLGAKPAAKPSLDELLNKPSDRDTLVAALQAADTPTPAHRWELTTNEKENSVLKLLQTDALKSPPRSPLRTAMLARIKRSRKEIVELLRNERKPQQIGRMYYDTLPWLAFERMGRIDLLKTAPNLPMQAPKSGSEMAGLLFYAEYQPAFPDSDIRIKKMRPASSHPLMEAANLAFDKQGEPLREPPFHNQMSDAVFMNAPLLSRVGGITNDDAYFDACAQHVQFILKMCQRDDDLYRHSPQCEAAWGRGNGFVAMGLALVLEDFPEKHPAQKKLLAAYQSHMAALKKHQDYTGCWHQVIDHPESYREFTATCMIGFAMARGIRGKWIDAQEYQPCVDRAWQAALARTSSKGEFADVCTGTGKQQTLRDYFDREATQGKDARGTSMLLMFATERKQ